MTRCRSVLPVALGCVLFFGESARGQTPPSGPAGKPDGAGKPFRTESAEAALRIPGGQQTFRTAGAQGIPRTAGPQGPFRTEAAGETFWTGGGEAACRTDSADTNTGAPFDLLGRARITGTHSDYHGFDCCDFFFEGREAKIVSPKKPARGLPWLWRARFWGHFPQAEIALLEHGFFLVYCDVAELYGNAEALGIWNRFYLLLTGAGLSAKPGFIGYSRGGFYAYRWAAAYPDRVACVYADAPVLDMKSWAGGKGKSPGTPAEWARFKTTFGLTSEEEALAFKGNPLDLAGDIAAAGFPMLHICGDADISVPIGENTDPFEKRILAAGGRITVIRKPGAGHRPHGLPDPKPIVDFFLNAVEHR